MRRTQLRQSRHRRFMIVSAGAVLAAAALVTTAGTPALGQVAPSIPACTVSATLVNSCRPWMGAAARGNPGIPGQTAPGTDAISQFEYLEQLVGRNLDTFRDYHDCNGSTCNADGLPFDPDNNQGAAEIYFAEHGVHVDSNWTPATQWADADGGNNAVNQAIAQTADNIKAVSPNKIFLTIGVEPQNDVTPGTSSCANLVGSAGSPQQYIEMWQNVENIFSQQGVTNVVWAMDYMSDSTFDCLVPQLWPGNATRVDWVFYDSYDHDNKAGTNFADTAGRFYNYLATSPGGIDFAAKPWGLGELGTCVNASPANSQQYWLDASTAVAEDSYPNLKLYQVFAISNAQTSPGCLTDFDPDGTYDPTKQTDFNKLADTILPNPN